MIKITTDLLVGHAGIDGIITGIVPLAMVTVPVTGSLHLNIDHRGWLGVCPLDSGEAYDYADPVWSQYTGNLTVMGLSRNVLFKLQHGRCYEVAVLSASRKERLFAFFAKDQYHITVRKPDELVLLADRFHTYRGKRAQSALQRLKWLKRHMTHGEAKSFLKAIQALDTNKTLSYRVSPKFAADYRTQVGAFLN